MVRSLFNYLRAIYFISEYTLKFKKPIWIAWETQRRTIELAKKFGIQLYIFDSSKNRFIRYISASVYTLFLLIKSKPDIIFVQNPSIVLTLLVSIIKKLKRYILIVDRHSNFHEDKEKSLTPFDIVFRIISNFTIKAADLTIVTNEFLKNLVDKTGGSGFVLTDKIPSLKKADVLTLSGTYNVVFISSYAVDEPYLEVFKAAKLLPKDVCIYSTGDVHRIAAKISQLLPPNLIFTGFLKDQDFIDLLSGSDVIMDLTTDEFVLVCGGYEAMSVEKPFITSNKKTLIDFYPKGVTFTDNTAPGIAQAILNALSNKEALQLDIKELKAKKATEWDEQFACLKILINNTRIENN